MYSEYPKVVIVQSIMLVLHITGLLSLLLLMHVHQCVVC